MKAITLIGDQDERESVAWPRPECVMAYVLTAGAAQSVAIPTGARIALFNNSTSNFFVAYTGTAVIPTTNITNGTAPEMNPSARDISGLASLSVVAQNDSILSVTFFG